MERSLHGLNAVGPVTYQFTLGNLGQLKEQFDSCFTYRFSY